MSLMKYLFCLMLTATVSLFARGQVYERTDTLFIQKVAEDPVIDGSASDAAWQNAEWQSIGEVWMPYNNLSSNLGQEQGLQLWENEMDFTGRYKVMWSQEKSLLYVVAEITDDVFVDGYVYNENPNSGGGYPNYDILEVFIDEDRSGGLHVFDGSGSVANNWGSNAENAFSYHLAVDAPNDGEVQQQFHALDIAGSNWGYPNQKVADYAGHFMEFALKREDNTYIWEFSIVLHDDSYSPSNPEASAVGLEEGKVLGLSMAYCDNDNPGESPKQRDHFFGSVYVPAAAYNNHWMDADWYGVAKLAVNTSTSAPALEMGGQAIMNSYYSGGKLNLNVQSAAAEKVNVRVLNILGKELLRTTYYKTGGNWSHQKDVSDWQSGVYLVEMVHGTKRVTKKVIIR